MVGDASLLVKGIRVLIIFLGFASLVISIVEAKNAAVLHEPWAFLRWIGRFLMVFYIVYGAWYGIHHNRPWVIILPVAPVAFLCLIIGYMHNYLDKTDSAEKY